MNLKQLYQSIIIGTCLIALGACSPWDDHVKVDNERKNESVMHVLSSTPELSKFAEILKKTGYDEQLQGNTVFTVFAPTNEALSTLNMTNMDEMRALVQNHLAYTSFIVLGKSFKNSTIEMINSKKIPTQGLTLNGSSATTYNIAASNGILHIMDKVITTRLNIWEYLQTKDDAQYGQVRYIKSLNDSIMDPDKSILLKYDEFGNPVFLEVKKFQNLFLDKYPLHDETKSFAFVLINSTTFDALVNKYAPYFIRMVDLREQDMELLQGEVTKDMILAPVDITTSGTYLSVDGLKIQLDASNLVETYEASNGKVYEFNHADVKLYENKVKTIILEGENYTSVWADRDAWSVRNRAWAQGGKDLMLSGRTINKVAAVDYNYYYNTNLYNQALNAYAKYKTTIHSVEYKMYIKAYDDIADHYLDLPQGPMQLAQKLLISLPEADSLRRDVNGNLLNNFKAGTVFGITTQAGLNEELQLKRYKTANANIHVLNGLFTSVDEFGDQEIFKNPNYGLATLMLANSAQNATAATSGLLFIDYIKLVPIIDPND